MRAVENRHVGKPGLARAGLLDEVLAAPKPRVFEHLGEDSLAPVALDLAAAPQRRDELVRLAAEGLGLEAHLVKLHPEVLAEAHIGLARLLRRLAELAELRHKLVEERPHLRGVLLGKRLCLALQRRRRERGEFRAKPLDAPVCRAGLGLRRGDCAAHQGVHNRRRDKRRAHAGHNCCHHRLTVLLVHILYQTSAPAAIDGAENDAL